jgi:hypothetical protein
LDRPLFHTSEPKNIDLTAKANILTQLRTTFDLPISDDYLYEEFGVEKPKDYQKLKEPAQPAQEPPAPPVPPTPAKEEPEDDPDGRKKVTSQQGKKTFSDRVKRFFGQAPRDGAVLDW